MSIINVNEIGPVSLGSTVTFTANSDVKLPSGSKLIGTDTGSIRAPGNVIQVVQTVKTDTFYSGTAETWYDITGMSANITPFSISSKVLVQFNLGKVSGINNNAFRIMRNGSLMPGAGDAVGSRQQAHFTESNQGRDANHTGSISYAHLDSPATTSSITYQLQVRAEGVSGLGFGLNRTHNNIDGSQGYNSRTSSTVILMEISG